MFTHALRLKEVQRTDNGETLVLETRAAENHVTLKRSYIMAPGEDVVVEAAALQKLGPSLNKPALT